MPKRVEIRSESEWQDGDPEGMFPSPRPEMTAAPMKRVQWREEKAILGGGRLRGPGVTHGPLMDTEAVH